MFLMVLVTGALLALVAASASPALRGRKAAGSAESPDTEGAVLAAGPNPETLEGVLVGQLLRAEISTRQYLYAMERLASATRIAIHCRCRPTPERLSE